MTKFFEHLELPKTNISLPKRPKNFPGKEKRSDRPQRGSRLLKEVLLLTQPPARKHYPFGINPKLIFKIKVVKNDTIENHLPSLGLNLLAKEPKSKQAIVVFADDAQLSELQKRLECYGSVETETPEYGYLDDIESISPLEPEDRMGPLLKLEPLTPGMIVPLDVELWHTGKQEEMQNYIREVDEFLRTIQPDSQMKVTDRYIGEYLCLLRIQTELSVLEILLQEYQIKEIDRRPKPAFESPAELNIPLSTLPEVEYPPRDAGGVLVIDSGVQRGHPLLGPALGDAEVFADPQHNFIIGSADDGDEKTGGHGTGVAGIAIYGDLEKCLKDKSFQPQVWIFSARVTNQNNEYDPDLLLETQLDRAINYFVENYPNCKVINISLGDSRLIYQEGQKQFILAAKIDEIAYKLQDKNIIFVISAGNFYYTPHSKEQIYTDYPTYLLSEEAHIIEPATAAIALTVGSLSMGKGSCQYPDDAARKAVAKIEKYPSPFTRCGWGVDGMIKPELVDFGGDFILDRDRIIENDIGASVITLNKNYQGSLLFKAYIGTSFAAPRVANLAAKLFTQFPDASSNLIRALIADSAKTPDKITSVFEEDKKKQLKVYGYGQPDFQRSAYSTQNQVVLLVDREVISVGDFTIYEIPALPADFLTTKGTKILSITLAFDPPTRHTRGDSYLGVAMEFHLFRNVDLDSLKNAFVNSKKLEKDTDSTEITLEKLKKKFRGSGSIEVDLSPKVNIRKKGTLQKGQINLSKKRWQYSPRPMYLVVNCNRKWAKQGETDSQRYALVVSINHSDPNIELYNQIKLKTRIVERVRMLY
jgi:Subtilase family